MRILNRLALAMAFAFPVAALAQTSGAPAGSSGGATTPTTDQPVLNRDTTSKAERDRPQGGSTAGANGRQDPTIKLSTGASDSGTSGSGAQPGTAGAGAGPRGKPNQGGTTAGANGAQDPTIKSSERAWDSTKGDQASPRPQPSK